jgi:uncharacterized protein (UPF0548 family)
VVAVLFDGLAQLAGYTVIGVACAIVAVLLIRVGTEQPVRAQIALLVGGVALGLGAGLLVAGETFTYFELDGEALDLMRTFDGPLIGLGFAVPALLGLNLLAAEPFGDQRRTFFHLGPPTREQLSRLAEDLEPQVPKADVNPLAEVAPAGYRLHRISRSVPDFENSCEALWNWAGHEAAGIELTPEQPPILIGRNVLFTVPVGPFTITSTGRIAALISDEDHYGFVYSTLDHHPFVGTEAIILDKSSGQSTLTSSTVWRPNCLAARLARPIADRILDRTVSRYLDGIADAETATIGARMMDLMSDMSKRHYEVSRDAIRAESTATFPSATNVMEEEVATQPLSEFEALFTTPLKGTGSDDQPPENDQL